MATQLSYLKGLRSLGAEIGAAPLFGSSGPSRAALSFLPPNIYESAGFLKKAF